MTRIFTALALGILGFLTGALAVWVLVDLPGVSIPRGAPFWTGCATGLACLIAGYAYSDKTIDALGEAWRVLWELSVGVLATLRSLIR